MVGGDDIGIVLTGTDDDELGELDPDPTGTPFVAIGVIFPELPPYPVPPDPP